MEVFAMEETYTAARRKWQEYVDAVKKNPGVSLYLDMKKVYFQLYRGKKVIDIHKVMKLTGVHQNGHPKLAITKATATKVYCHYFKNGEAVFTDQQFKPSWNWKVFKSEVKAVGLPSHNLTNQEKVILSAPVPIIPPKHMPDKLGDDYYILWEVDTWTMEPPVDPFLLRRITDNIFVIVSAWDLTEVERSVMKARLV